MSSCLEIFILSPSHLFTDQNWAELSLKHLLNLQFNIDFEDIIFHKGNDLLNCVMFEN
jgi:hypothetical protein